MNNGWKNTGGRIQVNKENWDDYKITKTRQKNKNIMISRLFKKNMCEKKSNKTKIYI